ncbi:hypothetical protein U0070_021066, partial [Myodes glareolus]
NPNIQKLIFIIYLFVHIATIGNIMIVVTIVCSPALLGSSMYFFLAFLSLVDTSFFSAISLSMREKSSPLKDAWSNFLLNISLVGLRCCSHSHGLWPLTCLIVNLYTTLLEVLWLSGGFLHSTVQTIFTLLLPFCGPNVIDHFMSNLFPLLELPCTDIHIFCLLVVANSGFICILVFFLLLIPYDSTVLNGNRKYCKLSSIFYTMLSPLIKALIYTFRNKYMKNTMWEVWKRLGVVSDEK